jgi:hypothetical protein
MATRQSQTGRVLEEMALPALQRAGYTIATQVTIGTRPGGRPHKVDVRAERDGRRVLVSLKWQQVSGTAEQKVPFEVMSLAEAVRAGYGDIAYLVLGGTAWTLRAFFMGPGLADYFQPWVVGAVTVCDLETFITEANQVRL